MVSTEYSGRHSVYGRVALTIPPIGDWPYSSGAE